MKKSIVGVFNGEEYFQTEDQSDEEIMEFLESLTKDQFSKIENFFKSSPKIVQKLETDCPKCKSHNISRIEGLQNFFV